jgi:Domain of unknown function (DUF397)
VTGWRKSSRSNTGNCVEAASWRTSSHSVNNGACVEVGRGQAAIGIRDSKLEHSPVLVVPAASWVAFTGRIKGDV